MTKVWDIVVVGAGILGMSTAKSLLELNPNQSILVVEKYSAAGQGNTGKSNAAYRNVFGTKTNIVLCNSSISYYKHLQIEAGIDLELKEFGYLWLLSQDQYEARTKPIFQTSKGPISFLEFLEENNVKYEIFNSSQLEEAIPSLNLNPKSEYLRTKQINYGLLGQQCGTLSPDLLVKSYEKLFRNLGGEVFYNCLVKSILLKEKGKPFQENYEHTIWKDSEVAGIEVEMNGNSQLIRAKKVLLATGAWINQLLDPLGIASAIKPKKRQLFRVCNLEGLVTTSFFSKDLNSIPFLILPISGIFIKPIPEAKCADIGCSDDISRRFEGRNTSEDIRMIDPKLDQPQGETNFYIMNILPVLSLYFPSIFTQTKKVETPSAGMYAYSYDKNPIIEKVKQLGNLYFCSGASGSGIMKADAIGRIAAAKCLDFNEIELYGGYRIRVEDFSLDNRNLEKESMVL